MRLAPLLLAFVVLPPPIPPHADPDTVEHGDYQLDYPSYGIGELEPWDWAPRSVQVLPPSLPAPSASTLPVTPQMRLIEPFSAPAPAAPPQPYLTPLPEPPQQEAPGAPEEEAAPEQSAYEQQAQPATPAPAATAPAPPRVTRATGANERKLQAQIDAQNQRLEEQKQVLQQQQQTLADQQQQVAGLQDQLQSTQAQLSSVQSDAQQGLAQSSTMIDRGQELAAAGQARAQALSDTANQMSQMLDAMAVGYGDFEGALGQMAQVLDSSRSSAGAANDAQEVDAIEHARFFLDQARLRLSQSDLFNARWNLGSAIPFVSRASNLAASDNAAPVTAGSTAPSEAPPFPAQYGAGFSGY